MNENLKAFLQKVSEDEALQTKLAEINAAAMSDAKAKMIKLAEEIGYTFTAEDMEPEAPAKEKLDEDELNTVAGGAFVDEDSQGKLYSNCICAVAGTGESDDYQKSCACVLGGAGELTALGKKKAEAGEIKAVGAKGKKVAFYCALAGVVSL